MSLDNSPSFEDYPDGVPVKLPDLNERRRQFQKIILFMVLVVALIGMLNLMKKARTLESLAGTGNVLGRVVDQNGQPFEGSIFILGTQLETETEADGSFSLEQVPSGKRTLVVADAVSGLAFEIEVAAAKELQMGEIRFIPTGTP